MRPSVFMKCSAQKFSCISISDRQTSQQELTPGPQQGPAIRLPSVWICPSAMYLTKTPRKRSLTDNIFSSSFLYLSFGGVHLYALPFLYGRRGFARTEPHFAGCRTCAAKGCLCPHSGSSGRGTISACPPAAGRPWGSHP